MPSLKKNLQLICRYCTPILWRSATAIFYLKFADAQKKYWFLKVYQQLLEADIELVGIDLLQHFRYSAHKPETTIIHTGQTETQITLQFELSFGKEIVSLPELQKMLLSGQKALLLKDGTLGVLSDDWLARYSLWIKHGKVKKNTLTIARWMAFSQEEEVQSSDATAQRVFSRIIPSEWWQKWKHWQQSDSPVYSLPPQVQVQALRSYQQKGYDWMNILAEAGGSACLADDMGLGKTLQTICFMANRLHTNLRAGTSLFVRHPLYITGCKSLKSLPPVLKPLCIMGLAGRPNN